MVNTPISRRREFEVLRHHSWFLIASMNLASDRAAQLDRTMRRLGLPAMPVDREEFLRLQIETAREIGGVRTRLLLDAPQEVEKYHFGPLQIALAMLSAMLKKYRRLARDHAELRNESLDEYCQKNRDFVNRLDALRDSIAHQRYDNVVQQESFTRMFDGVRSAHFLTLLTEGANLLREYLERWSRELEGGSTGGD